MPGKSRVCAHCGLPVSDAGGDDAGPLFCCHACRVVALIVGKKGGQHEWNLVRLGFGTLLAMNVMMISLLLYSGSIEAVYLPLFRLILLCLSTSALVILLPPFVAGALRECAARKLSLDALIACGALAAFSVSAVHALRGEGPVYFDTATMLPVLVTFGKIVESCAKTRASELMNSLQALLPAGALRVCGAETQDVAIEELKPGDLIRVRPGERIAVDGSIREGTSCIEEAAFTGEFLPRTCGPGDLVFAGTINGTGSLLVEAQRTGTELLLHGILAMVGSAWNSPSQAERGAQRAATVFVPILLVLACGTLFGWTVAGHPGEGLLNALSVLVVACPCTMGIATPLATSLAIARAARSGVVVRGGDVMERIAGVNLVFFDKTGTVTEGHPALKETQMIDPSVGRWELLGRLAVLESAGSHLFHNVIAAEAALLACPGGGATNVRLEPGFGISGEVTWEGAAKQVTAGSASYIAGILETAPGAGTGIPSPVQSDGVPTRDQEFSLIDVAWEGKLRGRLLFSDTVRADAQRCVAEVTRLGVSSVLLSGDRLAAAASVAGAVGIARVSAPCAPAQKLEAVSKEKAQGKVVAMVGDGINDAPALAAADVGIAFCAGTEFARQAGNVVVLSDSLAQVPWLIELSRQTGKIIRGNFAWSFGYNGVALAAAVAGLLHPLLAALAMAVSSITVLGNSLRITSFPDTFACGTEPASAQEAKEAIPKGGSVPLSES